MNRRLCTMTAAFALLAVSQFGLAQQWGMVPVAGYGHPGANAPYIAYGPPTQQYGQAAAYVMQPAPVQGSVLTDQDVVYGGGADCNACGCGAGCSVEGSCDAGCNNAGCYDSGCNDGGCYDGGCYEADCCGGDCGGCCGCGCSDCCGPKCMVFGEFLYLRPADKELAFAVPINGAITDNRGKPNQIGAIGVLDPDFESGFRVGFATRMNETASLGAQYTWFESRTENFIETAAPLVLRSLVQHPGPTATPTNYLQASARYDIDFQIIDVDYRVILLSTPRADVTFIGGGCFAHESQVFASRFEIPGIETVDTDIVFDGGGLRLGLEAERRSLKTGLLAYGRTSARFVAGEFRSTYSQGTGAVPVIVDTRWTAARVVSILDLELGLGWTSSTGCCRLNAGWMFSGWFNAVNTHEWIQAVHTNNFIGLSDSLTFNGLVARAELRW